VVSTDTSARVESGSRCFWISIALLTVFAVALRVLYLNYFGERLPAMCDATAYRHMGRLLARGHGYVSWTALLFQGQSIPSASYPPLYPALLALIRLVGLESAEGQRLAVAALGAANVPILALVGRRLAGPIAGGVAAALTAMSPALIEIDGAFMTEGLYLTLVSLALLATLYAEARPSWRSWGIVGALLGFATLTRSEGVILLGLAILPIAWALGRGRRLGRRAMPLLAAGFGLTLVVAPWTIRNAVQIGAFIPVAQSHKGVLVGANCDLAYRSKTEIGGWIVPCVTAVGVKGMSEAESFERYRAVGMKYALDHPQDWPRVVAARVLRTWGLFRPGKWFGLGPNEIRSFDFAKRTMWTGWLLIVIAPIGLALVARKNLVHMWLLLAPILTVTLTTAIAYGNPRFRAAAEPSLILLAAIACAALWQAIHNPLRWRPLAWLVGALLLPLLIVPADALGQVELGDRPNIVLIIGDDHGYPYAGFMGNEIVSTPHLDRLAEQGTLFEAGYNTASTCRPSMMSLLTGFAPLQLRPRERQRFSRSSVLNLQTLPSLLSLRGYRSFQAGKHWAGSYLDAGFSEGTKVNATAQESVRESAGGKESLEVGRSTMKPILDFLDRNSGDPFLLWFSPFLPHLPLDADPEYIKSRYGGKELSVTARKYYANVSRLDDAVGTLVARLNELELREKTLIVYLSDNGWRADPDVELPFALRKSIGGLRGKATMAELGFRTPIIFNWPGHVPAGRRRSEPVSTLDLFPTLLEYAGLVAPASRIGRSLRSSIETGAPPRRKVVIGHQEERYVLPVAKGFGDEADYQEAYFLRSAQFHYVWYSGSKRDDLFDIVADPDEERDIAAEQPERVKRYREQIMYWRRRVERDPAARRERREAGNPAR